MSASAGGRRESAGGPPLGARPADLVIRGLWSADGHRFARWSPAGRERIRSGAARLRTELAQIGQPALRPRPGGTAASRAPPASRTRPAHGCLSRPASTSAPPCESIDHRVLLDLLVQAGATLESRALIAQYLALPDARRSGRGLAAGGSLSPLPAALYPTPLDRAMESLQPKGVRSVRFVDDYVICAPTRHKLKTRDPQHARRAASAAAHRSSRQTLHRQNHQGVRSSGAAPAAWT